MKGLLSRIASVALWVARRWACIYTVFFLLWISDYWLPGVTGLSRWLDAIARPLVVVVGRWLTGTTPTRHFTGSGDTLFAWVLCACQLAVALVVAALLTAVRWRRGGAGQVATARLRMVVRYALAGVLLAYGLSKVFPVQFPFPSADRLLRTYSASSPMGVLWTMMGYSYPYSCFAGALECACAVLLLWERTATLGAALAVAVMSNVLMLNLCFDVPVKLFSMHLVALAAFVAFPGMKIVFDVLVRRRRYDPDAEPTAPPTPGRRRLWLTLIMTGWIGVRGGEQLYYILKNRSQDRIRSALVGTYLVDQYTTDGRARPPLTTDGTRWSGITFDRRAWGVITYMDDRQDYFRYTENRVNHTVEITYNRNDARTVLNVEIPDEHTLRLDFNLPTEHNEVTSRRLDPASLPLVSRGFHWVQEYPLNR